MTYREVGIETGLRNKRLEDYVSYMIIRWSNDEQLNCQCGYAQEWADRFNNGIEFQSSDLIGQRILQDLAL